MRLLRRLTTTLLLLFCLVPLGTPLGVVLCFGADGHIAFEPIHKPEHRATSPAAPGPLRPQLAEAFASIDHSRPCVDIAFFASDGGGQLIPASGTCPKHEIPVFVSVLLVVPTSTELPVLPILPERTLPNHHPLTILRSVVLHI